MKFLSSNIFLLTFLYFIQGLPYGFQSRFMPIYLRTRGMSLTNVGFFKMLLAPWLCKALWAPLVDKRGTKHQWLLGSILGLVITCALSSLISPDYFLALCLIIFFLNVCAATQDIAVDSIAVTILSTEELAKGNTAQVVGYKLGAIFGGGFLVWFLDHLGWGGLFMCLTVLYLQAFLFVFVSPELRKYQMLRRKSSDSSMSHVTDETEESLTELDEDLIDNIDEELDEKSNKEFEKVTDEVIDDEVINDKAVDDKVIDGVMKEKKVVEKVELDKAHVKDEMDLDDVGLSSDDHPEAEADSDDTFLELRTDDRTKEDRDSEHATEASETEHSIDDDLSLKSTPQVSSAVESGSEESVSQKHLSRKEKDPPAYKTNSPKQQNVQETYDENDSHKKQTQTCRKSSDTPEIKCSPDCPCERSKSVLTQQDISLPLLDHIPVFRDVLKVSGTTWMIIYVLIYKLGEQGALGMLPLFLVDQDVRRKELTFWNGVVGQAVSIGGSLLGGWILSKSSVPHHLILQQLGLCRLIPLGALLWVVAIWQLQLAPSSGLFYIAIFFMVVLLFLSGIVTTVTFTFMMRCSQHAPADIQATHYTTLSTLEVLGKLSFGCVTGFLVDIFGYEAMFLLFIMLTVMVLPWLKRCPPSLLHRKLKQS